MCNAAGIDLAASIIEGGGVAIFPTDTVYGIGCDPYNADAVRRVYRIKERDPSKPLPVLVASITRANELVHMRSVGERLASKYWPGALTLICGIRQDVLPYIAGPEGNVAVRVPAGRCISSLLSICGVLVGTSANISGEASSASPDGINIECDVLLDGGICPGGIGSTIVDCTGDTPVVVRQGALQI